MSEEYNGSANRETHNLILNMSNDEALYEMFREVVSMYRDYNDVSTALRSMVDTIRGSVIWDGCGPKQRTWANLVSDVGSFWRIDWDEVTEWAIAEFHEADEDE